MSPNIKKETRNSISYVLIVVVLIVLGAISYVFLKPGELTRVQNAVISSKVLEKAITIERVIAPEPLKINGGSITAKLDQPGTLAETNKRRAAEGEGALIENALLDRSAQMKLKDMADKQYFEHISPDGKGPSDLAHAVGYDYILIGENLALGNFQNDQALLDAWMASPGHRANILNKGYREIGVAVGRVTFQGNSTWLAVQEFGKPAADCSMIDDSLKATIDAEKAALDSLEASIKMERAELDASNPRTQADRNAYNEQVKEYNTHVEEYSTKADTFQKNVSTYNAQVEMYDSCIAS